MAKHNDVGTHAEWTVTATADNLAATATKAAATGQRHYITGISASFSVANIKLLTLTDGGVTIGNYHVNNSRDIVFDKPLKCGIASAVAASLAASGTATQIGAVTMTGFTAAD